MYMHVDITFIFNHLHHPVDEVHLWRRLGLVGRVRRALLEWLDQQPRVLLKPGRQL